jgi:hypothetical protein
VSLDIWSRDDIRNVILAANAASADIAQRTMARSEPTPETQQHLTDYRAGYEAALMTLATAFGIPLVSNGRLRSPGVAIPGGRLAVSYRAEHALARLLQEREEIEQ